MEKKEINTSNIVLLIMGILLAAFIVAMIYIYHVDGGTPDILISCVFGAFTSEAGILGFLKANKRKYESLGRGGGYAGINDSSDDIVCSDGSGHRGD